MKKIVLVMLVMVAVSMVCAAVPARAIESVWINPDTYHDRYHSHGYGYGYDDDYYSRHWGNGGKWDIRNWAGIIHEARPVVMKVIETIDRRNDDSLTHERVQRVYEYRRPRYSGYPQPEPQYDRYERRERRR